MRSREHSSTVIVSRPSLHGDGGGANADGAGWCEAIEHVTNSIAIEGRATNAKSKEDDAADDENARPVGIPDTPEHDESSLEV